MSMEVTSYIPLGLIRIKTSCGRFAHHISREVTFIFHERGFSIYTPWRKGKVKPEIRDVKIEEKIVLETNSYPTQEQKFPHTSYGRSVLLY